MPWDLLIAHPDCTYLTVSANRWAGAEWRMEARHWALAFVRTLWAFPVKRKCLENPVGVLPTIWKPKTQCVQPWQFGHFESKATCLWLQNLPALQPTNIVWDGNEDNKPEEKVWKMPPSADRWKERSRTCDGIAQAMAEQWGALELEAAA